MKNHVLVTRRSDARETSGRPGDSELQLLVPDRDETHPEVSIVVPAMNEEKTVHEFVAWCRQGLEEFNVRGEILIVDSSADSTAAIAVSSGARVLRTPPRGLGRAYIDALPYIRGQYVVMGDADCTYDFRDIGLFVEALRNGAEFVMGSRWLGTIEPHSMPALHRYLGTPITTWVLNQLYGCTFTDIHCGMRAIRTDALLRMGLISQSWEYASEMVVKSVRMGLTTQEIPVKFYKDRTGRESHHKRAGWSSPFKAAWLNLRAMFIHGAEFFMLKPGLALLVLGLILALPLSFGSISIGSVTLSLYWMLVGVALSIIGLECFYFGCLAQVFCSYSQHARERWTRVFPYTRTVVVSVLAGATGLGILIVLLVWYTTHRLSLPPASSLLDHLAVTGLLLLILGFSTFCFTLVLHATGVRYGTFGPASSERHARSDIAR